MDDEPHPTDGCRAGKAVGKEEPGPTQVPSAVSLGIAEAGTVRKEIVRLSPMEAVRIVEAGMRGENVTTGAQRGARTWQLDRSKTQQDSSCRQLSSQLAPNCGARASGSRRQERCINHQSQFAESRLKTRGWERTHGRRLHVHITHNTTLKKRLHYVSTHHQSRCSRFRLQQVRAPTSTTQHQDCHHRLRLLTSEPAPDRPLAH